MQIDGRTTLLTGATGGLGRAIASELAGRGARLVLSSRKPDELADLERSLPGDGHRSVPCDLAEPGAVDSLLEQAGEVEILVANAALPASGVLTGFSAGQLERAIRVNLEVPIAMAHRLVVPMTERGSGQMVFIGSLSGKAASPRASLYNATKFGIRGFALALRQDLAGSGVGVSVVEPGFVREAGMFADSGASAPAGVGTATPEQVGEAVASSIEHDRGEVVVAPIQQRVMANFALRYPGLAGRLQRGVGISLGDEIAAGQQDKR